MDTATDLNISTHKQYRVSTKLLIDVPLLISTAILLIIGLLTLYSASWNASIQFFNTPTYYVLRQTIWITAGLLAASIITFMDYRIFAKLALPALLGIIVVLLGMILFKEVEGGYTRSVFDNSVQPSEFAKLALVVYLSYWLSAKQDKLSDFYLGSFSAFCIIGVVAGLIIAQPDVSAALTIVLLGGLMFFIAGGNMKHIFGVLFLGGILIFLGYFFLDKVTVRINDYLAGLTDPQAASYHIQRSFVAILRGGLFGAGLGKGSTKITGLPVAWTDSIFAVILEETGLFGGVIVIMLYMVILWRGYEIFKKAPDTFGRLLAAGTTIWIMVEVLLNIAVMVNILPFAGNALPLISLGGSSMVCTLSGIGILMSISRSSAIESIKKGRSTPDALISLRRRDWGWRISSSGRSADKE